MSNKFLSDVVNESILAILEDVNTCIPGVVTKYNPDTLRASVRPSIYRSENGEFYPRPTIHNVPIVFPSSSKFGLFFPLEKGDDVVLYFSQRSIEGWKDGDRGKPPRDLRKFHIGDCFAAPITTKKPNSVIEFTPQGLIKISNENTSLKKMVDEVVLVLEELVTKLTTGAGLGNMGGPVTYPDALVSVTQKVNTLKQTISQFTEE